MITKIMQTLKYNSRSNFMKTLPPPKPSLKDPKAHAQLVIYRTRLKSKMTTSLPHFASGEVVKGFGRGSKQLGIPTANFPTEVVQRLPGDISTGVYFGWAQVESSPIYKMVMSIGWNPFYKNKEKSMETHIIHKFEDDFYGKTLKVAMLGYIRPELDFSSIEELKETIWSDIRKAEKKLELSEYQEHKDTTFFSKVLNADDCIK